MSQKTAAREALNDANRYIARMRELGKPVPKVLPVTPKAFKALSSIGAVGPDGTVRCGTLRFRRVKL